MSRCRSRCRSRRRSRRHCMRILSVKRRAMDGRTPSSAEELHMCTISCSHVHRAVTQAAFTWTGPAGVCGVFVCACVRVSVCKGVRVSVCVWLCM
jgi:hypothetical protein